MISFPNVKINIGLYVTSRRGDGFHNLESIFYPVPFTDVLEILPADSFSFSGYGIDTGSDVEDNLCVKAYRLLQQEYGLPPVQMHLLKNIPAGAGLGGGSSDASHALKMLNELAELKLGEEKLEELSARLGSDCPFFIRNRPAYVTGRGEILEDTALNLQGKFITLIMPGVHIATGKAFAQIKPAAPGFDLKGLHNIPIEEWRSLLRNDFEAYAFEAYPELKELKDALYEAGAEYAAMSGSGSTIYAISGHLLMTDAFEFRYKVWQGRL